MFNVESTASYNVFMSIENKIHIQTELRKMALQETGYTIDTQDDNALTNVMKVVWQDNFLSQNDDIVHANTIVIHRLLPEVIGGIRAYVNYVHRSNHLLEGTPIPVMDHPAQSKKWRSYNI